MFVLSGLQAPQYFLLEIPKKFVYPPCLIHLQNRSLWVPLFRCRLKAKSMKRLSIAGSIKVNGIIFGSTLQIGDLAVIQARSQVLAVQRQIPQFWGNEGSFRAYPIFNRPIERCLKAGSVTTAVDNLGSVIKVGKIHVLSLSSAATLQVGSNRILEAESRILNIRQFVTDIQAANGLNDSNEGEDGFVESD
jgi:spore germination protein PE